MYTLFGYKGSGSAAVECALEMAEIPYQLVPAASWDAESGVARLEHVNPLKQIPTLLLADGTVVTESAAILIHLGLEYPGSGLLPPDPVTRAAAIRGLVYIAANCYSLISIVDFPERYLADPSDDVKRNLVDGVRTRLHAHWDIFARCFIPSPYLFGPAPGALDLLAAVVSKWAGTRQHLLASSQAFSDYLHRVESHERVKPVFARHWDK